MPENPDQPAYHFSQVRLRGDILQSGKLHLLGRGDGYGWHQALWRMFPSEEKQPRDFLYRAIEQERIPGFYLVSRRIPEDHHELWEIRTKSYVPRLHEDERLAFSLRANPRITRKFVSGKAGGKHPPKHDVFMDAKEQFRQQHNGRSPKGSEWQELLQKVGAEWFLRQGERLGFAVESVRVDSYQQERFRRGKQDIRFSTTDFEGLLRVRDPEAFRTILFTGLGGSRSFGCGLLLVRKV